MKLREVELKVCDLIRFTDLDPDIRPHFGPLEIFHGSIHNFGFDGDFEIELAYSMNLCKWREEWEK